MPRDPLVEHVPGPEPQARLEREDDREREQEEPEDEAREPQGVAAADARVGVLYDAGCRRRRGQRTVTVRSADATDPVRPSARSPRVSV